MKKELAEEMSAKSLEEAGEVGGVEGMGPVGGGLLGGEIPDDELNLMIERAVRDAELRLAGTAVVVAGAQDEPDFIRAEGGEDDDETVH